MKRKILITVCILWASGALNAFSALTEPDRILFGKITNHYYGYEQILYEGTLEWHIKGPDESFVFTTALESLSDGHYSYKLEIPEKAAIIIPKYLEIESDENSLILNKTEKQYDHVQITVNGLIARIKEPGKAFIVASQNKRGQALRLDLEITDPPIDTDSDGLPDFWEDQHGFNKYLAEDAQEDSDQDGWSNQQEFEKGTHPHMTNTIPGLSELSQTVYVSESGKSMLSIQITDSDTPPENINLSFNKTPSCGNLIFKGQASQESKNYILEPDQVITAKHIQDGWLYYEHIEHCLYDELVLTLWDQDKAHSPVNYTINVEVRRLSAADGSDAALWAYIQHQRFSVFTPLLENNVYTIFSTSGLPLNILKYQSLIKNLLGIISNEISPEPGPISTEGWPVETNAFNGLSGELVRLQTSLSKEDIWKTFAMLKSKWQGVVLADQSHETRSINLTAPSGTVTREAYENSFVDTYGTDENYIIIGGLLNDTLTGGHENDILMGGPGADLLSGKSGSDIFVPDNGDQILDFQISEHDTIDLSHLFLGSSNNIDDYLQLSNDGINTYIKIAPKGDKVFDQEIILNECVLTDMDQLWTKGHFRTGHIRPELTVDIQLVESAAIETLSQSATACIHFSGSPVPQGLMIPIEISGTAIQKTDYTLQAKIYDTISNKYAYVDVQSLIPVYLHPDDTKLEIIISPVSDHTKESMEDIVIQLKENNQYYDINGDQRVSIHIIDGPDIVCIESTTQEISESNDISEHFILKRSGSIDQPLVVKINIQGTATNGIDYQYIPSEWTIPSEKEQILIPVEPNRDRLIETPDENIDISILPSDHYQVGKDSRLTMMIKDMPVEILLETGNDIAERKWEIPAIVYMTRSFIVDSEISVQLKYSGSAINGRDFEWLSDRITFGGGLSKTPITIMPKSGDIAIDTTKRLEIEILPENSYTSAGQSKAVVYIVHEKLTVSDWISQHFPENENDSDHIRNQDTDADGLCNFEEYAYGLNPLEKNMQQSLQRISQENGYLQLTFGKSVLASEVKFIIEISDDLSQWHTGEGFVKKTHSELIDSRLWESWQSVNPVFSGKVQFMRLRMEMDTNE
jgi:hypothetical protein